jgi:3-dehydroquinate synthase class II
LLSGQKGEIGIDKKTKEKETMEATFHDIENVKEPGQDSYVCLNTYNMHTSNEGCI